LDVSFLVIEVDSITSKPIGVKQPYLVILISDKGKLGGVEKLIQRDTILYFSQFFIIPTFTKSKRVVNISMKI
jgi:hypothetical protein